MRFFSGAAVDTNTRTVFSDFKLHQQVANLGTAVMIYPAELERLVRARARSTRKYRVYANTSSFICCAALAVPGLLCVVGYFYPTQCPS